MNAKYEPLLSLQCFHDYYTKKICPDLIIEPTEACTALLADHRMLFKSTVSGGAVLLERYNTGTDAVPAWTPVVAPTKGIILTFKVTMKNPLFLNITDTVQQAFGSRRAFVFANSVVSPVTIQDGKRYVSLQTGVLANALDTVGSVFTYPVPLTLNPASVSLHDAVGTQLKRVTLKPGTNTVTFDLQGALEGNYELRSWDGSEVLVKTDRFFVSDAFLTAQLLGYIQIHFLPQVMDHINTPHIFTLSFKNRAINWRYKLTVKKADNGAEIETSKLTLVNPPVNFTRTVIPTQPNMPKRVDFKSNDTIAIKEASYGGIGLRLLPYAGEATEKKMDLIKNMPNPDVHRLVKDGALNLRSEMVVNLKIKKEV